MTLFDPGTGPIRDLAWLDPTGSLRAEWERHVQWRKEDGETYRPLPPRGLGPISVTFTEEGPVEYCSIAAFRLLSYRILSGQWQPPNRVGCSPDAHDYNSPEGQRWAIEVAFGFLGMKTPYTDTFHVWDVPRPWEVCDGPKN
jgi:hypothetical protein